MSEIAENCRVSRVPTRDNSAMEGRLIERMHLQYRRRISDKKQGQLMHSPQSVFHRSSVSLVDLAFFCKRIIGSTFQTIININPIFPRRKIIDISMRNETVHQKQVQHSAKTHTTASVIGPFLINNLFSTSNYKTILVEKLS